MIGMPRPFGTPPILAATAAGTLEPSSSPANPTRTPTATPTHRRGPALGLGGRAAREEGGGPCHLFPQVGRFGFWVRWCFDGLVLFESTCCAASSPPTSTLFVPAQRRCRGMPCTHR